MAKKAIYPNIVRGGIAIPILDKTNYYYMKGRKHKDGGIDIGSNPRTGIEVEDGEVLHLTKNNVKVFSSLPFLNGQSPAQKVLGGNNPNEVFKQQENFKDRNNINDDGTKRKVLGGDENLKDIIRTENDKNVSALNRAYYSAVNPLSPIPGKIDAIKHGLNVLHDLSAKKEKTSYEINDNTADAAWRKRLGLSYDEKDLPSNTDGSVRLPKNLELEIPVDTNVIKNRINTNLKALDFYKKKGNTSRQKIVNWAIDRDSKVLDSLRHTYKTGEPVVINEQVYNSRGFLKNGNVSASHSPLNILHDYTVQYDKDKNVMRYSDVYDFNKLDWAVPGKPYNIKGEINLNKKLMGGNHYKPVTVTVNGKTKVMYSPSTGISRSETEGLRHKGRTGFSLKVDRKEPTKPNSVYQMNKKDPIDTSYGRPIEYNNSVDFKTFMDRHGADLISALGNITGGIVGYVGNRRALNSLQAPSRPIPKIATKLKTRINTAASEDKMRESLANYERNVNANTASSRVALARSQKARLNTLQSYNQLQQQKENIETELINKDRLNRQSITNQNISDHNNFVNNKINFGNKVIDAKSENFMGLVNTINAGLQNTITNIQKRNAYDQDRLAIMAANPNVNPRYLKALGIKGITNKMIRDWDKANNKSNG